MLKRLVFILTIALTLSACGSSDSEEVRTAQQVTAPQPPQPSAATELSTEKIAILQNAVFEDFDGNEKTLSDYKGKIVLIDLWETWCVPCLVSFPTLQRLMDDYPDDFVVLAVSPGIMDSPDQVREFAADHDYTFEYLFGYDLADELQLSGIPFKIYFGPDGSYIKHTLGSRGPERDYQDVKDVLEQFIET